MFRAETSVCCLTREIIRSPCLGVVACARPDRIQSLQSFDCFHRLSLYFTGVSRHI